MQNLKNVKELSQTIQNDMLMGMNIKVSQRRAPNWVQLKSRKTSFGSNKNKSSHKTEHSSALYDNTIYDIVKQQENTDEEVVTVNS